ncbi:hypothetical protein Pan44_07680 [Caulifigura coniformis]|uniref:Secreted protein n=1 Tax=Caulifigura coniformis TaxID=2527983 RepID=A0A517S9H6_9PLAN|nr:hypothetical protein [Caulifigura coniformis]QDT52756.1 hypothetical protein Pan44_07680 [Caulifigura coniformis]
MIRSSVFLCLLLTVAFAWMAGCQRASERPAGSSSATKSDSIAANLAKLPPEDRAVAEAQGYCAAEPENPLGGMGVPIKVMVKDQPVFVCCAGCEKKVLRDADVTLAEVADLKAKVAAEKAAKP